MRAVNLANIKQDMQFGNSAKDFLKSLPTMAITTGVGTITLNELVQSWGWPEWTVWLLALLSAGAGYIINIGITQWASKNRQALAVRQDYERDMFYLQYLIRVRTALINLYYEIDRIYADTFGKQYALGDSETPVTVVEGILKGAQPTMCDFVHAHMNESRISANLWTICETGGTSKESCKYFVK